MTDSQSQPCGEASADAEVFAGLDTVPSAAKRLTRALEIASLYGGGISFGEGVGGDLMFGDIRAVIAQRDAMLEALTNLAGMLCGDTFSRQDKLDAYDIADAAIGDAEAYQNVARAALSKALGE